MLRSSPRKIILNKYIKPVMPFYSQKIDEFGASRPPQSGAAPLSAAEPPEKEEAATADAGRELADFYASIVQTTGERWSHDAAKPSGERPVAAVNEREAPGDGVTILPPPERSTQLAEPAGPLTRAQAHAQQAARVVLPKSNVGYQLLAKAGWSEGMGLGAREQGTKEPVQLESQRGSRGLGFAAHPPKERGCPSAAAAAATAAARPVRGTRVLLPPDDLAAEDIDTKVKRVKQVMQAEADDKAGKEIARFIYSAGRNGDTNPLLRGGKSRLSASNPLL